ncbi:MAG TPA: hypothetical protein DHV36_10295 [Desulfobacteraceae bacterium]|nr:hypothetical protein [Desulfobacteraceae bacterium]
MIELSKYELMNKALHNPDWTAKADLDFNIEDCWISDRVDGHIKFTQNYLEYVVADAHKKALLELVDLPDGMYSLTNSIKVDGGTCDQFEVILKKENQFFASGILMK